MVPGQEIRDVHHCPTLHGWGSSAACAMVFTGAAVTFVQGEVGNGLFHSHVGHPTPAARADNLSILAGARGVC